MLAWREILASHGLPYNFAYFSVSVASQQGAWECGYLCVYLLLLHLQGLAGLTFQELKTESPPQALKIDGVSLSTQSWPREQVVFQLLKCTDSYYDNIERLCITKWATQLSAEIALPDWLTDAFGFAIGSSTPETQA